MTPDPTSSLGDLIVAKTKYSDLEKLGVEISKIYTNHGLPIDMALDRLKLNQEQKLTVLDGCCQWLIEHRRLSGAPEKAIERQRKMNRKMIEDFIVKGETNVY